MRIIAERTYHPAIEAAVSYWCGEMSVEPGKLEKFRKSFSDALAEIFDSAEGFIEINSTPPNKILQTAMKKAKMPLEALPQEVTMTISTTVVKIYRPEANAKFIWKAPGRSA